MRRKVRKLRDGANKDVFIASVPRQVEKTPRNINSAFGATPGPQAAPRNKGGGVVCGSLGVLEAFSMMHEEITSVFR